MEKNNYLLAFILSFHDMLHQSTCPYTF